MVSPIRYSWRAFQSRCSFIPGRDMLCQHCWGLTRRCNWRNAARPCVSGMRCSRSTATQRAASYAFHREVHKVCGHQKLFCSQEDVGEHIDTVLPPGLSLMKQSLNIAGRPINLIVPRNSDAVVDMAIDAGEFDRDPYWCRVWPSALALAELILQNPELVAGKSVCDVGAGLGLAGIAAALAGAKQVVMLDYEPLALQCALLSAEASGLTSVQDHRQHQQPCPPAAAQAGPEHSCAPAASRAEHDQSARDGTPLVQQHFGSSQALEHLRPQVYAELFDWSQDLAQRQHDVALACDVLYAHSSIYSFAKAVPKLLNEASDTLLLLADPSNRTRENRDRFLDLVTSHPTRPATTQQHSATKVEMDGQLPSIELYQFLYQLRQHHQHHAG